MRNLNLIYDSAEELQAYLHDNKLSSERGIIQLFSGRSHKETSHFCFLTESNQGLHFQQGYFRTGLESHQPL